MRVRDIMTKAVLIIPQETSVEDAARIMRDNWVGLLAIGSKDHISGVITDRDLVVRVTAEGKDAKHTPVSEAMTKQLFRCFDDQDVEDACFTMQDKRVRRLRVFNRRRDLAGVLSLDDVATRTHEENLVGYALSKVAKIPHV
jgi:CBS domain-containing protein